MQLRKTPGILIILYCCLSVPVFASEDCPDEPSVAKVARATLADDEEAGYRPLTSEELAEQQDSIYAGEDVDSGYRQRSTSSKDCEPQKSLTVIEERGYRPLQSGSVEAQPAERQVPAQPVYPPQTYAPQSYVPQGYVPYYPQPGYWPGTAVNPGFYPGMMYGNPYRNPWPGGGGYPYGTMPQFIPGYGIMPYSFGGFGTAPY